MNTNAALTREELDKIWEASQLLEKELLDPSYQSSNKGFDITPVIEQAPIDPEVRKAIALAFSMAARAGTGAAHHMGTQLTNFFLVSLQAEGHDPVEFVQRSLTRFNQYYKDPGPDTE